MQPIHLAGPKVLALAPFLLTILIIFCCPQTHAQTPTTGVYVDEQGVMRWEGNNEEIHGFGVNYTVPFAHAYRSAIKLGIDPLKAIDEDVYHFSRLGFDLYRVHVWDTEISDTLGNLRFNEHLYAFDYLLKKLSERNINYVLTPIAYWGNGWPEPDEATPGFSARYGKGNCLTDPAAIAAQENYLYQFMEHINPFTGVAYKNDPHLIAVEVSNEPHHREAPGQVTEFVQRMVTALRKSGYKKPVFYNISHSVHLADNYFQADIQGGTFQWYPTGLGYQRELPGNFLPAVDQYTIPFDPVIRQHKGAKLVYEFDAADIGRSYIYPAMARSFRKAGIQIATHFAYDPTFLAYANTEYNTHYMNLAYAPQKALSLKICSEVFHRIPLYQDFGNYPDNTNFNGFSVSYEQDLAQLNVPDRFFYTNNTSTVPVNTAQLAHIAGYGSSPVVAYQGSGAYFLDQLEPGVWRLEVMPDALIIDNPYGRNSLDKTVAMIQWNARPMTIRLPDLGSNFKVSPLNAGNTNEPAVSDGGFVIRPGTYLLSKTGQKNDWAADDMWQDIRLGEFHAPPATVDRTYLVHQPAASAPAGGALLIRAQVISPEPIVKVQVFGGGGRPIEMQENGSFTYEATVPADRVHQGLLQYYLVVQTEKETITFPSGKKGTPFQWDFYDRRPYQVRVNGPEQPIFLFDAEDDAAGLSTSRWLNTLRLVPLAVPHQSEYQVNVDQLFQPDNENLKGPEIQDYSIRHYLNPKISTLRDQLKGREKLVLSARSLNDKPAVLQIALTDSDGNSYGKSIRLSPELKEYTIPIRELRAVPTVILPRPYPTFLPYYFSAGKATGLKIETIESVQFSLGPGTPAKELHTPQGVALVSLWLE